MSQKDTILDVLRRAQQPLEPKITKNPGERPAARRSGKGRNRKKDRPGDQPLGAATGGKSGLPRLGMWLAGEFTMPRAGLYLGLLVAVLLAAGAYNIGVRKGSMGSTAYAKNKQLASVPLLVELDRKDDARNTRMRKPAKRDQGNPVGMGGLALSSEDKSGKKRQTTEIPALPHGKVPLVAKEESITVLRLMSNPDSPKARKQIEAMRDWMRQRLSKLSVEALRSVQVYSWMSSSSRRGGAKSVCLEVTLPETWDKGRFLDVLAGFGDVRTRDFSYPFSESRSMASPKDRKPSEIAAVLERETAGH